MLPSLPRARRRVGGPAKACDERGAAEAFGGGLPEVSGEGASGESENWPRPAVFNWFRSFTKSKQSFFGSCLGYPFLWYPTVAPEPREECGHSPKVLTRLGS